MCEGRINEADNSAVAYKRAKLAYLVGNYARYLESAHP